MNLNWRCLRSLSAILLLCTVATNAYADWSIQEMFDLMDSHQITGATIITHGFTLTDDGGGYMASLAQAIQSEVANQTGQNVWLLDYDINNDGETGFFNSTTSNVPTGTGQSGHAILLYDWSAESNEDSQWWADMAGDALFSLGAGIGVYEPRWRNTAPTQFIGHSFGTVATTEAVERLAGYQTPVAQVTLLDPHDFDQSDVPYFVPLVPNYDGDQKMFELGAPTGYGATIWENVEEADVYYQTRGFQGTAAAVATADPEGRPIAGAYNRHIDGAQELPASNPYGLGTDSDHGYVWNSFYVATVSGSLPAGAASPADSSFDFNSTGWAHSIHNQNRVPMPSPNFYSSEQDHEHSETYAVLTDGSPNESGLLALGLSSQEMVDGHWASEFQPGDIANGDFSAGERTSLTVDLVAGWSHHGGGGDSEINEAGGNYYLTLDVNDVSRTHNYTYIPANATTLEFDFRVDNPSEDDWLSVSIGDTLLGSYSIATGGDWYRAAIPLPSSVRDSVQTFTFELGLGSNVFDDAELDFDNLAFGMVDPTFGVTQSNGTVFDLGQVLPGETVSLLDALGIGNIGDADSYLDIIDVDFTGLQGSGGLWDVPGYTEKTFLEVGDPIYYFDFDFLGSALPGEYRAEFTIVTNHLTATYEVVATVVSPFSADFDNDGDVDQDDLTDPVWGWLARYGIDLDGQDLLNWQRQYTGSLAGDLTAVATIPEPSGMLLLTGLALLPCRTMRYACGCHPASAHS